MTIKWSQVRMVIPDESPAAIVLGSYDIVEGRCGSLAVSHEFTT